MQVADLLTWPASPLGCPRGERHEVLAVLVLGQPGLESYPQERELLALTGAGAVFVLAVEISVLRVQFQVHLSKAVDSPGGSPGPGGTAGGVTAG
jgi:hypothetical protein